VGLRPHTRRSDLAEGLPLALRARHRHTAVKGIAQACVPQPDEMLYDLLAAAIGEYAAWSGRDARRTTRRNTAMVAIAP
jgi:hypothetical protein